MDEGYIKFETHWKKAPPLPEAALAEIQAFRQRLYELGLIGAYPNGIGYGNISRRFGREGQFIISGSATGNFPALSSCHYTLVTKVAASQNQLWCEGPIVASSESMSHAAVYEECPWVNGVIHVHHAGLWNTLLHKVPTTDKKAPYGSPEMVASIIELMRKTKLKEQRIFVMEGHEEGIFSFGSTLEEAFEVLMIFYQRLMAGSQFDTVT
ncbi:MAG: class II aldolase/adducin family protein [Phaeodactylibacter sp.]|nr:class II aldolase/adducin family protein [Phaeodactylibacter sp.]MCB9053082.1 class II aldolase/adducin family protein [Lewinellaceae bacterium]